MPIAEAPPAVDRFPCAQCGADLRYSPGADQLVCAHCGHRHPIGGAAEASEALAELDFRKALARDLEASEVEETQTVRCDNCGATTEFDPDLHAAECPFCAAPIVTDTGAHRHFKPRGVLPFALDERQARDALARWLEGLWFAPSDVRLYARASRPLSGLYLPYWTFDAQTQSRYSGARGDVYYVTVRRTVMRDGKMTQVNQRVAKVRWRPAAGRVSRFFDDVLILASRALPPKIADQIGPWDLHGLMPYDPAYLAGFRAEAYTIDLEEGFAAARAVMDLQIRRDVRFDIGGDRQRIDWVDTETSAERFKHILCPVWLAAYRYRGKSYRFVVNGRTGRVTGERPYSGWKIALASGLALMAIGAAIALAVAYG